MYNGNDIRTKNGGGKDGEKSVTTTTITRFTTFH